MGTNIFAYTAPGPMPRFVSLNEVDGRLVLTTRPERQPGCMELPKMTEVDMTLPDEQLLKLAHDIIKYMMRR